MTSMRYMIFRDLVVGSSSDSTDAASQLDVLGHDGAQVGVLEETDEDNETINF